MSESSSPILYLTSTSSNSLATKLPSIVVADSSSSSSLMSLSGSGEEDDLMPLSALQVGKRERDREREIGKAN